MPPNVTNSQNRQHNDSTNNYPIQTMRGVPLLSDKQIPYVIDDKCDQPGHSSLVDDHTCCRNP